MPEISKENIKKALEDAGLKDAARGVIFPWGAKIVEVEGKKYLRPMSPDEYRKAVFEETGKQLSDKEVLTPSCAYDGYTSCISQGCNQAGGSCRLIYGSGGYYCLCNY